ncbi:neural proliferation differentiation and control protein 1-like [Solea senegalensis]|uniref:Neural proliferation differentiation and control protein 1-like n=1 Tax=Solea senegalensis TaxID=28829 RepID=A0AAV6R404_SOLSE|nr:neural proliferation differentiation and control protein 1a [Solea senegalensis]KAG7499775.1 neural proliferation differentiation and control protein 1-like [Solea senegalensis]
MLLLSSPRSEHLRGASLLPLTALLLGVVSVSVALPASPKCPHHINCAREGRHFCQSGSSHCGPCLDPLQENEEGRCVKRRKHQQRGSLYPDLDEEIDYLQSILEKQALTETKPPKKKNKHPGAVTALKLHAVTEAPNNSKVSAVPHTPAPEPRATQADHRGGPIIHPPSMNDRLFILVISLCVAVGTVAVILAIACYIKLQKDSHLAQKVDYPAFSRSGMPAAAGNGPSPQTGDKTLAQNAQMYHYQHQKQQMLSMGNSHKPEQKSADSEVTSDEEEVGGDFTVYECPGLAPTGEMEVKNPLFDDSTLQYQGNHK